MEGEGSTQRKKEKLKLDVGWDSREISRRTFMARLRSKGGVGIDRKKQQGGPLHSAPLLMWANTLNPSILLPPTHPAVYPPSYLTLHPSVHLPSHPTSIHPDFHRPATHPPSIYPPIYHLITLPHTHVCIHTPTVPPFHRPPTAPSVYVGWFLWGAQMNTSSASRCPRLDPD